LLYSRSKSIKNNHSRCNEERLHKILVDACPACYTHKDITYNWSAQSLLAENGPWKELKKWQEVLKERV